MELKELEGIFDKCIGENKKITDIKSGSLVQPGENYGGEMFKLQVTVQDEETKKEFVLHAVGKTIPLSKDNQEMFNIQVTFKAEMLFYEKIVPILQKFQKDNGVENVIACFPKFYGGRLNLNGSGTVDMDGILIMENLKISGFTNLDRHIGYDLKEATLVLKDLAEFQSTAVALKIKQPEFFFEEIRPLCNNFLDLPEDDPLKGFIVVLERVFSESEQCAPFIPKIRKMWNEFKPDFSGENKREPFATITHSDLWVNNAMMKYVNGEPVKNKFVDFQFYNYGSPGFDILNFLFTSVQTEVLKTSFDDLLRLYHTEFINNLQRLKCDASNFGYNDFLKELKFESEHVLVWDLDFIPNIVFGKKGEAFPNSSEIDFNNPQFRDRIYNNISEKAKERLYFMIQEYKKRNWF
ncbi:uncharacterized protein LOC130894443 [Diorhabda carinulata]|uniref:uncharacterized protein LOC130894443 n=1 Tax=Diorhabda carinulata TaxID=1163345 RepID=UPI0025A039CE|nr:uncharacterized protein LOC130894443 [Diorhabda carinulata]